MNMDNLSLLGSGCRFSRCLTHIEGIQIQNSCQESLEKNCHSYWVADSSPQVSIFWHLQDRRRKMMVWKATWVKILQISVRKASRSTANHRKGSYHSQNMDVP